eukprot:gene19870-25822_t
MTVGDRIWIPHEDDAWLAGRIENASNSMLDIMTERGLLHIKPSSDPSFRFEPCGSHIDDNVENLVDLDELSEGAILHHIRKRFKKKLIYTYVGSILVAVNPFEKLSIYTKDEMNRATAAIYPYPHVYVTAATAFKQLQTNNKNQSVLISGESGAGKTETTKKVLSYLATVTSTNNSDNDEPGLEEKILQSNPLLEALGNAKTLRNDNSSRFGILDIFGFEVFENNSFEQLCINYANEKLQLHFNEVIFHEETKMYVDEGASLSEIVFEDNAECVALIESKPLGVISLLDEECTLGKATDLTFISKLDKCFGLNKPTTNKYFIKHRTKQAIFSVKHFAGQVEYNVTNFLDKNRDTTSQSIIDMIKTSTNPLVQELFISLEGKSDTDTNSRENDEVFFGLNFTEARSSSYIIKLLHKELEGQIETPASIQAGLASLDLPYSVINTLEQFEYIDDKRKSIEKKAEIRSPSSNISQSIPSPKKNVTPSKSPFASLESQLLQSRLNYEKQKKVLEKTKSKLGKSNSNPNNIKLWK